MKSRGFTLIELLVVISIISLLSSIVLVNLQTARAKARDNQRVQALIQIRNALELFHSENGRYPFDPNPAGDTRGLSCWQCNDNALLDQFALGDDIDKYLKIRPCDPLLPNNNINGGCTQFTSQFTGSVQRGFFYKVNPSHTDYKIAIGWAIEDKKNVPSVLVDDAFNSNPSDNTISIYSSEKSRLWTRTCNFSGAGAQCNP